MPQRWRTRWLIHSSSMNKLTPIKIGATKQSFINVVIHSIGQWYKNNAITKPKNNTQSLQDKPKETNTNTFDVLKEKEPDTHITLFGCRVPVDQKKGIKWHIGQSSFQDEKETDTDTDNRINKVLSFSKVKKDFPSLGKPLESNHKWNGSQKVLQGNGLINPPKPDGWFGLNDINSFNQRMALQYRQDKVNSQIIHRRQQAEATDELGNIVDLEEYLRIQHDDLNDDDLNDDDLNDDDHDDHLPIIFSPPSSPPQTKTLSHKTHGTHGKIFNFITHTNTIHSSHFLFIIYKPNHFQYHLNKLFPQHTYNQSLDFLSALILISQRIKCNQI